MEDQVFRNRAAAGQKLAEALAARRYARPVVLAMPRGGVPVGFEVASRLGAPLDILLVRKIGAPFQPELGVGALVDGDEPQALLDRGRMAALGIDPADLAGTIRSEVAEIRRREELYRRGFPPVAVSGATAILVDDGIATGSSVRAALRSLRRRGPKKLVVAVPVAPPDAVAALSPEADEVVSLLQPAFFRAVGQFYKDFDQTSDGEVIDLLDRARALRTPAAPPATLRP